MKRRITILCANLKGNLGDFAIAEAVSCAARRYLGECGVHLYYHANKPADPKRLEVMLAETNSDFQSIQAAPYSRRPWWLRSFCRLGIGQALYAKWHNEQIHEVAVRIAEQDAFMENLKQSDLIVFAGGAQWGRGDLNMNMFAQLRAAASTGKRVCAFPFSVSEGLQACNGKDALAGLYAHLAPPVFVRDVISRDSLQSAGVDVELVCDSVFSLKSEFESSWDLECMEAESRQIVYLSLTQSGSPTLQAVVDMLTSLKAGGLRPVLFSNCEVEDRPFYSAIQEITEVEAVYPESWKQAVAQLSQCRFVITNRLHCLIFSALSGTPVIPVTNRLKTKAYVADANLPCSLDAPGALAPEQVDRYNQTLVDISNKQKAYAKACADMLDARLSELFRLEDS